MGRIASAEMVIGLLIICMAVVWFSTKARKERLDAERKPPVVNIVWMDRVLEATPLIGEPNEGAMVGTLNGQKVTFNGTQYRLGLRNDGVVIWKLAPDQVITSPQTGPLVSPYDSLPLTPVPTPTP